MQDPASSSDLMGYAGLFLILAGTVWWVYLKSKEPNDYWKRVAEQEDAARLAWAKYEDCRKNRQCDWPDNCRPADCRRAT